MTGDPRFSWNVQGCSGKSCLVVDDMGSKEWNEIQSTISIDVCKYVSTGTSENDLPSRLVPYGPEVAAYLFSVCFDLAITATLYLSLSGTAPADRSGERASRKRVPS